MEKWVRSGTICGQPANCYISITSSSIHNIKRWLADLRHTFEHCTAHKVMCGVNKLCASRKHLISSLFPFLPSPTTRPPTCLRFWPSSTTSLLHSYILCRLLGCSIVGGKDYLRLRQPNPTLQRRRLRRRRKTVRFWRKLSLMWLREDLTMTVSWKQWLSKLISGIIKLCFIERTKGEG